MKVSLSSVKKQLLLFFSTQTKPRKSAELIQAKKQIATAFPVDEPVHDCYKSFAEFTKRVEQLALKDNWRNVNHLSYTCTFKSDNQLELPSHEIFVNIDLSFVIRVYGWHLPNIHQLYKQFSSSMKCVTLSNLISHVVKYQICSGIQDVDVRKRSKEHCIPVKYDPASQHPNQIYFRSENCLLLSDTSTCDPCLKYERSTLVSLRKNLKRKQESIVSPAKPNAPISLTSPERIKLTLQNYRLENKELKAQIQSLQSELSNKSLPVTESLNQDLRTIMSNADSTKLTPFMKLFWEEQQKYLSCSSSKGIRYHPMIIRYCLSLASKSGAVYDELRYDEKTGTGVLVLPSRRRLRDYKNYIRPQRGFNGEIVNELRNKVKHFSEEERFMVLLLDEMKIQEQLVWDKHTGELIGFVDLGDIELNYATLEKTDQLATHVLVFMLRSIVNPFKFSFATFATTGATSYQMFPLLWKAVCICESNGIKVLAVTCDGASPNRKLFRMHFHMNDADDMNPDADVTYRTINIFSSEKRWLYFISDTPHLIKTARNCLANSGDGRCTRYMWNGGMFLIWNHIASIFYEDQECGLHLFPKLTYEHIKLTPYSVMNVRLAAQVLSSTVSKILLAYGPPDAAGTAMFCEMMDGFFDILNIRSGKEAEYSRKEFLEPFRRVDDPRFSWLRNVFLQYFKDWLTSIENRQGNFSKNAKARMFISWQTWEGIQITVHSIIEAVQFLLQHGVKYVLTERFCQDPLENYFGRQRSLGSRKDNPTVKDFGYNDNTIRNQKIFRPIAAGNVADQSRLEISDEPVPCRKKPRKI